MTQERSSFGERMVALTMREPESGSAEVVLTIENAIEDRVRAYSRLMRMKEILRKARGEA